MKKAIITLLVIFNLIIIVVLVYFVIKNLTVVNVDYPNDIQPGWVNYLPRNSDALGNIKIQGVISGNSSQSITGAEECLLNGFCQLSLDLGGKKYLPVWYDHKYSYGGCPNDLKSVALKYKVGDRVEVYGKVIGQILSTCESSDFYIRDLSPDNTLVLQDKAVITSLSSSVYELPERSQEYYFYIRGLGFNDRPFLIWIEDTNERSAPLENGFVSSVHQGIRPEGIPVYLGWVCWPAPNSPYKECNQPGPLKPGQYKIYLMSQEGDTSNKVNFTVIPHQN